MTIAIFCLDTGKDMIFSASSAFDAMEKALYTLNLRKTDRNAKIIERSRCLIFDHDGKTYSTLKDGSYKGR
jgi:hypothetical protein